jgi:hypothetical protein
MADVRPQPSVTHSLGDLTQLGAIGHDNEVDRHAVASPVREAEHPLSHRQAGCAIAEGGDHSGHLVAGDRRCAVAAEAIGPGSGPRQLAWGESPTLD